MRYRAVVVGVFFLVYAGCQKPAEGPSADTTSVDASTGVVDTLTAARDSAGVQVEDVEYSQLPGGARILTGTLYNPTTRTIENAQVQVSLLDADNRRISSMVVVVKDIGPGERRSFRKPVQSDLDVQGVKVRSVLLM